MNATKIDWIIAGILMIFLTIGGFATRSFIKSTTDWTVAGRNMRKFLGLSTGRSEGMGLHLPFIPLLMAGLIGGTPVCLCRRYGVSGIDRLYPVRYYGCCVFYYYMAGYQAGWF